MPRLETLSEVQRRTLEFFPCLEHETTPWVKPAKPLAESRLALVTSAGLHLREDKPFNRDDPGGRVFLPGHPQRLRPGGRGAKPLFHRL